MQNMIWILIERTYILLHLHRLGCEFQYCHILIILSLFDISVLYIAWLLQAAEKEKDTSGRCTVCQKHFSTQNAFQNHLQSKKHKELEAKNAKVLESQVQKRNEKNQEKGLETLPENTKVTEKNAKNLELKKLAESEHPEAQAAGQSSASTSGQRSASKMAEEDEGDILKVMYRYAKNRMPT